MKLTSFVVRNFRSVTDSGPVNVSDITCLIGANQSGKSSILQALASLSMDATYQDFDLTQLGGVFKRYTDSELKAEDIQIIEATFELLPDEQKSIKDIFPVLADQNIISLTKYYDNHYCVKISDTLYKFSSRTEIQSAYNSVTSLVNEFQTAANQHLTREPNSQYQSQCDTAINELKNLLTLERIRAPEGMPQNVMKIIDQIQQLAVDQPLKELISQHLKYVDDFAKGLALYGFFVSNMPRPVYFKTYDRLEDEASINELKASPTKYKTFINLLKLAGLKIEPLTQIKNPKQQQAYTESASGQATNLLREAWEEGLQVQFRFQGDKLMVFTKDPNAFETLLPPSSGSEGFQWFLGFYINFGAATDAEYKNAILLLDDPGVFLHPKGHKDLLELFEKYLAKNVTTIYATHLPFLVPKDRFERLRLVEKLSEGRSSVTEKFYGASDKDVLFPIRAAIGVTLGDSLFIGKGTIIAEGPSDHIFINGMMKEFYKKGKREFSDDVAVLGTQGADKTVEYAVLLEINGFSYIVVLDNDDKGKNTKEKLIANGIPESKIMLLPSSSNKNQTTFNIEDLFSSDIYSKAFIKKYGPTVKIGEDEINKKLKEGNGEINNKAKEILRTVNIGLDKVAMANEIMRVVADNKEIDETTTEAFGTLFDKIAEQIHLYSD